MLENQLNNKDNKDKDENKSENKDKKFKEDKGEDKDKVEKNKEEDIDKDINIEKNSKDENKEITERLKDLKIEDVYNNFFKKVICSKKLDSIRDILQKINIKYLNKIPNLYINHLNSNLTNINKIFEPIISSITIKNSKIIEKLKNQYEIEKDSFVSLISVFVFNEKENFLDNYNFNSSKNIKILNYRKKIIEEENSDTLRSDFEEWFNSNSKNKSMTKIIILGNIKTRLIIYKIIVNIDTLIKNKKDFIILYNDTLEDYKINVVFKNSNVFTDSNFEEIFFKFFT